MNKSFLLFVLAISSVSAAQAYIAALYGKYIISGHGIGIYAVMLYFIILFFSALLWLALYRESKNKVQAAVYWLFSLLLIPIIFFQPVWWATPQIN
ncbi:MAG: hypothetical protein ACR2PX_18785 [Endozoicomonas sp.]|uniref:hypothetical protein n=1 Tax=Endozoicomonas sp. TaxID=1892382 RepID=UPI003D9BF3F2